MEVASPLTIPHAAAGSKRSLTCSPGLMDATTRSPFAMVGMDMTDDHSMQRAFKRRRYQADTTMGNTDPTVEYPPFMNMTLSRNKSLYAASVRRCRQDALSSPMLNQSENLERVVETQAAEIEYLKNAKTNLESSLATLKSEHDKTLNENRILKRAVAIQQERQNQATCALNEARQFKVGAEENIRRLEQMILNLRYHLQTQSCHPGNDFMGFPPTPPDVY